MYLNECFAHSQPYFDSRYPIWFPQHQLEGIPEHRDRNKVMSTVRCGLQIKFGYKFSFSLWFVFEVTPVRKWLERMELLGILRKVN